MAPRTVDTDDRRVGWGHYQPDGSAVGFAAAFPSLVLLLASAEPANALFLSWPGVSASGISLTDSMVFCGPRMRRTLRYPNNASTPVTSTMIPNTIRNAAQR